MKRLTPEEKQKIYNVMNCLVLIDGKKFNIQGAIEYMIKSYSTSMNKKENLIKLPYLISFLNENNIKEFLFSFFPFVYGIYPYAVVTDKQRQAMNEAGVDFVYMSIYDIAFAGAKRLLGV